MTCLLMPSDWQRQSYLVRRWGEYVVSHSQQQLAIRCFMCTGAEPTEPWTSPAAQQAASFAEVIRGKSPLASPDPMQSNNVNLIPPPSRPKSASNSRPAGKTPALKLITSFDSQPNQRFRFPGLKSDDRTPTNAPGVTPIAESAVADSALSPGGLGSWKLNNIQSLSQAMTSRTNTPAFNRGRLPSIGETPVDVHPPAFSRSNSYSKSGYGSTSENDEASGHEQSQNEHSGDSGLLTLSAARYIPEQDSLKPSPQTAVQATEKFAPIKGIPSPGPGLFEALKEHYDIRNGSRDRKPDGLQIELLQAEQSQSDDREPSGRLPSAKSTTSTPSSYVSTKSPNVSGRSIDQYISSLEEANYHSKKHHGHRGHDHGRRDTDETASQTSRIHHARESSQETRGRNERRYIQPAKRSPSSPVPMSPEELARYHTGEPEMPDQSRKKTRSRASSGSKMKKAGSRSRQRSSSRSKASRVAGDRQDTSSRGRSVDRQGSAVRSPSSPLPMSLSRQDSSLQDEMDDPLRLVAGNRERLRSHHRSASRRRGTSSKREPSTESRHKASHSQPEIRQAPEPEVPAEAIGFELLSSKTFGQDDLFVNGNSHSKSDPNFDEPQDLVRSTTPFVSLAERKRRELAAAELEARRLSLARNPSAPNIPFPGELQSARTPVESPPPFHGNSYFPRVPSRNKIPQSKDSPEYQSSSDSNSARSGMPVGLPATPRAMRHPKYGGNGYEDERPPSVPALPTDTYNSGAFFLSDARYQGEAERIGRSMSVPMPEGQANNVSPTHVHADIPMHPRFNPNLPRSRSSSRSRGKGHRRTSSGGYVSGTSPHVTVSIEETIENAMQQRTSASYVETIPPPPPPPPILPELQHLKNTPPPPPPAPFPDAISPRESSATIDIAIDNDEMGRLLPRAMTAGPALNGNETRQSTSRRMSFDHRRNRSSNESFTNKLRSLTRMRSNSRSVESWTTHHVSETPYESVHSHTVGPGQSHV